MRAFALLVAPAWALPLASIACGGDEATPPGDAATGGAGGSATTSDASSASSSASTSSAGGASSVTSVTSVTSGSGGSGLCAPGAEEVCYEGAAGTEGVGACKAGIRTCLADGSAFGPCEGQVIPATETCGTAADENCDAAGGQCDGAHLWSRRFGEEDHQETESIAIDAAGNVLLAGPFYGSIDFGGGKLTSAGLADGYVAKLDPAGTTLWAKRFGGAGADWPHRVAADGAGNALVAGFFEGLMDLGGGPIASAGSADAFVAKLGPGGEHVWSRRLGGSSGEYATGLAVVGEEAVVAGYFSGAFDPGTGKLESAGADDLFVAKLDPSGQTLWAKRFGDAYGQQATDAAAGPAGEVAVAGFFGGSLDFGGGALEAEGIVDGFVVKLDAAGGHVWSRAIGGSGTAVASNVAVGPAGEVVVVGDFSGVVDLGAGPIASEGGAQDAFVAKFDASGKLVWSKTIGNAAGSDLANPQILDGVAVDGAGNVVLTGETRGPIDLGGGPIEGKHSYLYAFAAKFDGSGGHVWSLDFGGVGEQGSGAVAVAGTGHVVAGGAFWATADFGGGPLTSHGGADAFVVKLAP